MIPKFAVVGRSNKGKSSIVATLTENDRILVDAIPRTTRVCQEVTLQVADQDLLTVIDTPGFEQAPAVLEWLQSKPVPAHKRHERVREFLRTFEHTGDFRFECELLRPIVDDGASILYVADVSRPYRPNFEAEFEILRWTGQPSLALMNQIADADYQVEWQAALSQYFRKVKVFNAQQSWFADRMALLEDLKVMNDQTRPALQEAMRQLQRQQERCLAKAAAILAEFVVEAMTHQLKVPRRDRLGAEPDATRLVEQYQDEIRRLEEQARQRIIREFNYRDLQTRQVELAKPVYDQDLFSRETWELLGLSRSRLITLGLTAGAVAGGSVDALVGGSSFLVGTGLGALLGASGSAYLTFADLKLARRPLSSAYWLVGPNQNPNFPWILLDRGLSFILALLRRTHAERDVMEWQVGTGKQGVMAQLASGSLKPLASGFRRVKWASQRSKAILQITKDINQLLWQLQDSDGDERLG
jgi:hypothetical protein